MKTTLFLFLLFLTTNVFSQTTDVIYLPKEKTVVASLKYNFSPIGFYVGGYITKSFPRPLIYTTPMSIFNRVGLNFVGSKSKWGIMIGGKIENYSDRVEVDPDFWLTIYPLKIITNTPNGFDFVFALNYQKTVNYGIGLSFPF